MKKHPLVFLKKDKYFLTSSNSRVPRVNSPAFSVRATSVAKARNLKIPSPPPRPLPPPVQEEVSDQGEVVKQDAIQVVLDTNVLLDNPEVLSSPEEVLSSTLEKGQTLTGVVVPLTVVRELDKLKSKPGVPGRNSRKAVRILDGKDQGCPLSPLVRLETYEGGLTEAEFPAEWDPGVFEADTEILATTHKVTISDHSQEKQSPLLVSSDAVLRVKARHLGLSTKRFTPPPSSRGNKDQLYQGWIEIPSSLFGWDRWWEGGHNHKGGKLPDIFPGEVMAPEVISELSPHQFLVLKEHEEDPPVLLRFVGPDKPLHRVPDHKLKKFEPRNLEQRMALDLLLDPEIVLVTLLGRAGGGKTLCALAAGLHQVLTRHVYGSMVITRPVISMGKEIGFLPGTIEEKLSPWLVPIKDNLRQLLGGGTTENQSQTPSSRKPTGNRAADISIENLYERGVLEIQAMPFIRGRSISGAWFLVDEAQGTTHHEVKTILTRVGEGTKIILTGDIDQIDRADLDGWTNGLSRVVSRFRGSPLAGHITLTKGERSALSSAAAELL